MPEHQWSIVSLLNFSISVAWVLKGSGKKYFTNLYMRVSFTIVQYSGSLQRINLHSVKQISVLVLEGFKYFFTRLLEYSENVLLLQSQHRKMVYGFGA